eukprot:TRINITY_DN111_c0_g1_i1.p1 TRINITY_DN111_c0_g1~~TRINITY_DN111_c0_g1_i1.p1  ORF type:complete len:219 (-),score=33.54 TRINITY_DN111_c0_g1_i1:41-697(-)
MKALLVLFGLLALVYSVSALCSDYTDCSSCVETHTFDNCQWCPSGGNVSWGYCQNFAISSCSNVAVIASSSCPKPVHVPGWAITMIVLGILCFICSPIIFVVVLILCCGCTIGAILSCGRKPSHHHKHAHYTEEHHVYGSTQPQPVYNQGVVPQPVYNQGVVPQPVYNQVSPQPGFNQQVQYGSPLSPQPVYNQGSDSGALYAPYPAVDESQPMLKTV